LFLERKFYKFEEKTRKLSLSTLKQIKELVLKELGEEI